MTDESEGGMTRVVTGGALYLGFSQVVRLFLTILSTVIISRLLAPADYGVLAMVSPVIALAVMFQDLGLSAATIQQKEINPTLSNALFWITIAVSVVLAVAMVLVSPVLAWFLRDSRAMSVTAASGGIIVVTGLSLQHAALLSRSLNFRAISFAEVSASVVTFLVSAGVAMVWASYWALFLGMLAGAAVQSAMLWVFSSWRPSRRPAFTQARSVAAFGGHVTGSNLLNFVVRNADTFLIARMTSADTLGLYDRSYKLMMLPIQSINAPLSRLLLPVLSRLQEDQQRYREAFVITVRLVMLLTAPGISVAVALSDRVIPLLLGPRWTQASDLFFWLGLTGLVQPIANMTGVLFVSSGRTRQLLYWSIFSALVTLAGFTIGIAWGARGVAISLLITAVIRMPFLFWLSASPSGVSQTDLYRAQAEPLIGAAAGGLIALLLAPHLGTTVLLMLTAVTSYLLTGLAMFATVDGRATLSRLKALVAVFDPSISNTLFKHKRRRVR